MKALAGLLCVLLTGCVTAQSSAPSPTPNASITFDCRPIYCPNVAQGAVLEDSVLTAVAGLGYPVKSVTIGVFGYSCAVPDAPGDSPPPCPDPRALPRAAVSFVGTNENAVVELANVTGEPGMHSVGSVEVYPGDSSAP